MPEEKPFAATPARVARARREGDVAKSGDLCGLVAFACGLVATFALLPLLAALARDAFASAAARQIDVGAYAGIGACALGAGVAALAGAVAATYAQTRTFALRAPKLQFSRLDPAGGLRRMFSRDAVAGGAKAGVASIAVGTALASSIAGAVRATALVASPAGLAAQTLDAIRSALLAAFGVAACFAVADAALERGKWLRRLRMSFEELRRDLRQSDGDPHVRARRRTLQRSFSRGSIARLGEAAFVVTNPTHVAIALEYRPPAVPVPRVLVRAVDEAAREVKRRARALRVPVVENVALARALLAQTEAGSYIPSEAYGAVAAIVAELIASGAISA